WRCRRSGTPWAPDRPRSKPSAQAHPVRRGPYGDFVARALGLAGRAVVQGYHSSHMPLYKEQGIVLRSMKLGEADKIVTILTQGSGKIRAVAKGIRRTNSKFGARLEPLTHVSLLLYQGRNLDTVTQAEIISPFRRIRGDFELIAAAETMLEATDKVAEEHERNV